MRYEGEIDRENLLTSKKTRPTQASEVNSNIEFNKQDNEQDNQSFRYKFTEKNANKSKRTDRYGNPITKKGKQKVTFKQANFTDIIQIESYKDYNKVEEVHISPNNAYNSCCSLL